MDIFSNVKIPVFGVNSTKATSWTEPSSTGEGFHFSDTDWLRVTNSVRLNGVTEGIARSVDYNTVLRQCSTMTSLFANILAYRNSVSRGGVFPYGDASDAPIGTDLNGDGEHNMDEHIGALSEIFGVDKFLFDGEVVTRTLGDLSVTTAKLENSTGVSSGVTTTKIATDAVTKSKIGGDLINIGTSTQNGITVTLSQGAVSGNRGLQIGVTSSKVTSAGSADFATSSNNLLTNKSDSTIFLSGTLNTNDGTVKQFYNSNNVFISGGFSVNAGSFNVTSDVRLKENIENIGHNQVKSLVENVDVKTFNYKKDTTKTTVGVMAQDILCVNAVVGDLLVEENNEGFFSVRESKLIYILWDYVKQLERRVKELEEK